VTGETPLRVEQALRLLPDVDALTPLRAFLISSSRGAEPDAWDTAEPYRTVGRRLLKLGELRRRIPEALGRAQAHLAALYDAVLEALDCERAGNMPNAVRALLRAGASEEAAGHYHQAQAWYAHALGLSEALRDRRPEIEALCALGHLAVEAGRPQAGAREYQRALALAEAEMDQDGSIEACQGLGDVAAALGTWTGAESWYTRGQRLAGDSRRAAELLHRLARTASERNDHPTALERLAKARAAFETTEGGQPLDLARVLATQGEIELRRGRHPEAVTAFREAFSFLRRGGGDPTLEVTLRLGLTRAFMEQGRWREAEDECRRGEELAIAHNLTRLLARLYLVLGRLRGAQNDEDGFVFFEKAIELARGLEPSPRLEGESYLEYARFRRGLGDRDGARACFERALEMFTTVNYAPGKELVASELAALPPA
jgi:tetratricopeptide (TPR) repeat protein